MQKELRDFSVGYEFWGSVLFVYFGIRLCRFGFVLRILRGFCAFYLFKGVLVMWVFLGFENLMGFGGGIWDKWDIIVYRFRYLCVRNVNAFQLMTITLCLDEGI